MKITVFYKRLGISLVQIFITSVIGWLLFLKFDISSIVFNIAQVKGHYIALLLFIICLQYVIVAERLNKILSTLNVKSQFSATLQATLISTFFSQTPLSTLGGDVIKGMILHRSGIKPKDCASSVILERMVGAFTLISIIVLTIPWLLNTTLNNKIINGIFIILIVSFVFLAFLYYLGKRKVSAINSRLTIWIQKLSRQWISIFSSANGLSIIFLSLIAHFLSILTIVIISFAIKPSASWFEIFMLAPLPLFASLLPFSINGWGVRETTMILTLGLAGITTQESLSISIAFGLISLIGSLLGVITYLINLLSTKRLAID